MPNADRTTVRGRLAASAARLLSSLALPSARRLGKHHDPRLTEDMAARNGGHLSTTKSSAAGPLIAFQSLRQPVWTPRDYTAFAREGYAQNAIVYRCVRMIAEAAAGVPLLLYDGDNEITAHPLLDLVTRPNPVQAGPDLLESFFGNLLVSGNAYVEAVAIDGAIREMHALRPDRVKVVPGPDGWPEAWEYTVGGRTVRISGEPVAGIRPVLHMRLYHPDSDHYGMSPLEPAAAAVDLHNTAARWNKALLDNSARPSGALVYTARDGNLTTEQYERLKSELEEGFQGSANAGRPLLLEGGLDWKSMSLSPKDLDFIEARHAASREIALALGVPPMLLGIPGDNTYSNLAEAQRIFWRQTVLPLVHRLASALSGWLAPAYAEGQARALRFVPDTDALEALSSEREALWARLERTSFLTLNEKRAAAGYGPVSGGDELEGARRSSAEAPSQPGSGEQNANPQ
jgi:HK97 family phage portal protein